MLLFAAALLGSALLLFVMEPMFARMVLPSLGGGASVWTTCLVFYQGALLVGYLLAHRVARLAPRRQVLAAFVILLLAAAVLPIRVPGGWAPGESPTVSLLLLLLRSVGLPFVLLAASSPLLQAWFVRSGHPRASEPYGLYAASNTGSLAGLLLYPFLLEPGLTLRQQSLVWALGFLGVAVLGAACARAFLRSANGRVRDREPTGPQPRVEAAPDLRRRLRWLALALCPSSLLLGVTSHLSIDVAPAPLLWAFPLGLYLLSFVLCFGRRLRRAHSLAVALQPPLLLGVAAVTFLSTRAPSQLLLAVVLHLAAFFVTAMVCHGELAALRPGPDRLTEFYLWIALGGFLGGTFNALLAPVLFPRVLEYPIMLVAAAALRPARPGQPDPGSARNSPGPIPPVGVNPPGPPSVWAQAREGVGVALTGAVLLGAHLLPDFWAGVVRGDTVLPAWTPQHLRSYRVLLLVIGGLAAWALVRRALWFAGATAVLLVAAGIVWGDQKQVLYRARSFYGAHRIERSGRQLELYHGSTLHGVQRIPSAERREPLSYYHRGGPLGEVFDHLRGRRLEVGVVGLGVGSVAAYLEPGSRITFHEIDPVVIRIAQDRRFFSYLADCRGEVEVVPGDARLTLGSRGEPRFDLLILDAFGSDTVPIHLLTREAVRVYLSRLAPHGLLLIHISGRYLDLRPVVGNLAADAGLAAGFEGSDHYRVPGAYASLWAALAREQRDLDVLEWSRLAPDPRHRLWTDDHASPLGVLAWDGSWSWLLPWRWPSPWRAWPPR